MKKAASILMIFCCLGMLFPPLKSATMDNEQNRFPGCNQQLYSGDIIFRQGKGMLSDIFKNASMSERKYSHAGVLVIENNTPFVYHITGTDEEGKSGLKKERLADFCNSRYNTSFAFYRNIYLINHQDEIYGYLNKLINDKITFDDHFSMASDDQLYCTEMIYKMIRDIDGHKLSTTHFKGQDYVAIDNLCLDTGFHKITEYKYQFNQ